MKQLYLIIICSFSVWFASAQVTYTYQSIPYTPDPYNDGINIGLSQDDKYSGVVPIGFTFNFFGTNYDSMVVSTNGTISFDKTHANGICSWVLNNVTMPNNSPDFNNAILSPFQDLNPSVSATTYQINVDVKGVAPYRRCIISFQDVSLFYCNTIAFSNQVILYETTFDIDINIQDKLICPNWNTGSAVLGIQNATATLAYVPPGRDASAPWAASQESWRFSPSNGGPANTNVCKIKGNIFFDDNSNCIKDPNEYGNMNRYVLTNSGNYYAYTDMNGDYEMQVVPGNYTVSHFPYANVNVNCPSTNAYAVSLAMAGDSATQINFGDSTQICSDLYATIGTSNLRYCHRNLITVAYGNLGSIPENNATLTLTFPAGTFVSNFSIPPTSQSGNTFTFALGNVNPGQMSYITCIDSLICDTTLINTNMCLGSTISGNNTDCDLSNNTQTSCYIVVASFDPNQIQAAVSHIPNAAFVSNGNFIADEWITYKVDFQNTGTASAIHIRVHDELDATKVDINSVEFLGSSHLATLLQQGNQLDFYFNDIHLADSNTNEALSHGWLMFKVKSKMGLANNTQLANTANIYFDNNVAVNTNTSLLTIHTPEAVQDIPSPQLQVYPNPMSDMAVITMNGEKMKGEIILYNAFGEKVYTTNVDAYQVNINKMNLHAGLYHLRYVGIDAQTLTLKVSIQ